MVTNTHYSDNSVDFNQKYIRFEELGLPSPFSDPTTLWTFGDNSYGQLAQNNITNRSSPVQIGSASTIWKSIHIGHYCSAAIKPDGTLWVWGYNQTYGQLGVGNSTTNYSSPVQVGSLTNWLSVSFGDGFTGFGIKTDGTLWAWGYNGNGALGLGDRTSRSSPVQVGALTTWTKVAANAQDTAAIKTDGTLWTWGYNFLGRLGLGDTTPRSSPVQVGALTDWAQISASGDHFMAIKTDGTLWAWGTNINGQLGLGDTVARSSPVQVGTLTDWTQVSCGYYHAAAIKTDGTLWAWGSNSYGSLGTGNITNRSSPVQVGALTNWAQVSAHSDMGHTAAIKTDGTLWTWGENTNGQLGTGDTTNRSSPVQVGSLTNWTGVKAGRYFTSALKSYY